MIGVSERYGSSSSGAARDADADRAKTWLTPEQIDEIRDAVFSASPVYLQTRDETLVTVLADTGLRVGELVALDWELLDLDADPAEIMLPSEIQKGDPGVAYLDLAPETARQLRRLRSDGYKETEAVFYSRSSDRISPRGVQNLVKKLAREADVRPHAVSTLEGYSVERGRAPPEAVTPHTFRHSIAFRLIRREGKRLEDVKMRLRHRYLETTDRVYSHLRRR